MKIRIVVLFVLFLLAASNVLADDVSIDSSGNVKTGVSNTNAELEVTGGSGEGGILGSASGTGASGVYGINTTYGNYGTLGYDTIGVFGYSPSGYAGYFQGNAKVTGNMTVDGSVSGPNIGDITGVTAGTGLSGGGLSGDVTLNANTTYLQRRVSTSCTVGSSIRAINEDGTILCETDDVGITSESDPKVGSNTTNYIPKWSGINLVTGSIYDNGTIGIGVASDPNIKLRVFRPGDDYGAEKASIYGLRSGVSGAANGGTGWNLAGVDTAIKAYNLWGNQFTSGIAGYSDLNYAASAAVVGAKSDGTNRGMLGYKDINNDLWAGYFEGNAKVTGSLTASGGVKFPDGTVQTAAAAPSWHQILPAAERFVLVMNNNEAVLDKETGLVWEKSPSTSTHFWNSAIYLCASLDVGGRKGWHLPTVEQLASLVDTSVSGSPMCS